jgi:hypothetical protein
MSKNLIKRSELNRLVYGSVHSVRLNNIPKKYDRTENCYRALADAMAEFNKAVKELN